MKRLLVILIGCLAMGGLFPPPTMAQGEACPDTLPSRLVVGAQGQVMPGSANNLRADPHIQAELIGQLPANTVFDVLDGPVCADGYAWWQVRDGEMVGWTVEAVEQAYVLMPVRSIQAGGVSLIVDAALPEIVGEIVPGEETADWYAYPEHVQFIFNAGDENARYSSWLKIFPLAAYSTINPYQADEIHAFQQMLQDRPSLQARQSLPFLKIGFGSAQIVTAEPVYVDFDHLHGIRYLAAYAQDVIPIQRDSLMYIFQGITSDGMYYVSFLLPISVSTLPETVDMDAFYNEFSGDNWANDYSDYLDSVITTLDTSDPQAFSPQLEILDAMMGSIQIDPLTLADAIQAGEVMATDYDTRVMAWEYGLCGRTDLPSRLSVGDTAKSAFQSPYLVGAYNLPGGEDEAGWTIHPSDLIVILDGPVCVENQDNWFVYNEVVHAAGWVSEQGPFLGEEEARYYLAPAFGQVVLPDTPSGQTVTACTITPLLHASAVENPLLSEESVGRLKNGVPYYAEALLRRPEGGVLWWRLAPGATVYDWDEPLMPEGTLWVRASQVSESNGCVDMPVIEQPE